MKHFQPSPAQIKSFIIKHFGEEYKESASGKWWRICCPFDDDDSFKFNINVEDGRCHYWRGDHWATKSSKTGKKNNHFVNFVRLYRECSYTDAVKLIQACGPRIGSDDTIAVVDDIDEPREPQTIPLPDDSKPLAGDSSKMAIMATNWLNFRGVSNDDIQKYRIYYKFSDVIWPYFEFDELVYWQSRNIINKVFSFPTVVDGIGKSAFLYNFDNVSPSEDIVVTESIFGCLTLDKQTVASGGAGLSPMQVAKLKLLGPKLSVILAPDNDVAGLESIVSNGDMLVNSGFKVKYSLPPEIKIKSGYTKDWNELYTDAKLSKNDIWEIMVKNVKAYDINAKVKIKFAANAIARSKNRIVGVT